MSTDRPFLLNFNDTISHDTRQLSTRISPIKATNIQQNSQEITLSQTIRIFKNHLHNNID